MSNVIDFLERLGRDAQLRHATSEELEGALAAAEIEPAAQAAILGSDRRQLEALLGASSNVCCLVYVPEQEEEEPEGDEPAKPDDDGETEDEPASGRSTSHRASKAI